MKKKNLLLIFLVIILVLLSGCSVNKKSLTGLAIRKGDEFTKNATSQAINEVKEEFPTATKTATSICDKSRNVIRLWLMRGAYLLAIVAFFSFGGLIIALIPGLQIFSVFLSSGKVFLKPLIALAALEGIGWIIYSLGFVCIWF